LDKERALILLSGGLDSATAAAVALRDGHDCVAMTFTYGQRHSIEVSYARGLVTFFGIKEHVLIDLPSGIFSSALVGSGEGVVPRGREMKVEGGIPPTYVPARNILFLSYALAYGESAGIRNIYIGVNALDYSGYPDCRPEFIEEFQKMANIGTKAGVEGRPFSIMAPLMNMSKADIISLGVKLGVDYSFTHSCYDPDSGGLSCGECDSCILRKKGFHEAGVPDPTRYGR
jgi:7-cyano-7-deazaguanine synthase